MANTTALVSYFKRHSFGSQPAAMSILSILPPTDRCDILSRCLAQDPDNVNLYDKFALALLKNGQTANAYELVDGAVASGSLESMNGSILREKLKSLVERYRGNFGSTTSYAQAEQLLEKEVMELKAMNALDAHLEFIDLMRAYIIESQTGANTAEDTAIRLASTPRSTKINRGDRTLFRAVYHVNEREVIVEVEEAENRPGLALSARYRPNIESPFGGTMKMEQVTPVDVLISEVGLLMQCLDKTELKKQDYWDAFVQLIMNHIDQHGRLVDADLECYIDTMLIVVDSFSSAFSWAPLSQADGQGIRKEFHDSSMQAFRGFIWVRDPWQDHILGQPPKYIRLSDQ